MSAFIGIDLGTTFSAVATIDETGRPTIVPNEDGSNITPSCVVEASEGVMGVGEFARRQWGNAPETAAARFKRDMGMSATHAINGQEFTPTQLSTFVLKKLVSDAGKTLGPIGEAVVTIPANFPMRPAMQRWPPQRRRASMSNTSSTSLQPQLCITPLRAVKNSGAFTQCTIWVAGLLTFP